MVQQDESLKVGSSAVLPCTLWCEQSPHLIQCAAVTTQLEATRVAPHPPGLEPSVEPKLIETSQGYFPLWIFGITVFPVFLCISLSCFHDWLIEYRGIFSPDNPLGSFHPAFAARTFGVMSVLSDHVRFQMVSVFVRFQNISFFVISLYCKCNSHCSAHCCNFIKCIQVKEWVCSVPTCKTLKMGLIWGWNVPASVKHISAFCFFFLTSWLPHFNYHKVIWSRPAMFLIWVHRCRRWEISCARFDHSPVAGNLHLGQFKGKAKKLIDKWLVQNIHPAIDTQCVLHIIQANRCKVPAL